MNEFLKVSLRGLIVTLLLPFIVLLLALYTVYCIICYVVWLFRNIVIFFMGGDINTLKEDEKALKELQTQNLAEQNFANALASLMHNAIKNNAQVAQTIVKQEVDVQTIQKQPQIDVVQNKESVIDQPDVEEVTQEEVNND